MEINEIALSNTDARKNIIVFMKDKCQINIEVKDLFDVGMLNNEIHFYKANKYVKSFNVIFTRCIYFNQNNYLYYKNFTEEHIGKHT